MPAGSSSGKCEDVCTKHSWCIGYSQSGPFWYLVTSTGKCDEVGPFNGGNIAKSIDQIGSETAKTENARCMGKSFEGKSLIRLDSCSP